MDSDYVFFLVENQRHQELVQLAESDRLAQQVQSVMGYRNLRVQLGDLLIGLGTRLKTSSQQVVSPYPSIEMTR